MRLCGRYLVVNITFFILDMATLHHALFILLRDFFFSFFFIWLLLFVCSEDGEDDRGLFVSCSGWTSLGAFSFLITLNWKERRGEGEGESARVSAFVRSCSAHFQHDAVDTVSYGEIRSGLRSSRPEIAVQAIRPLRPR